jgi:SAM-dependent methyltransferase
MSERFPADWLTLREPADHAARSEPLVDRLRDWCRNRESLRIVDLGAGTGSNLRYLAPRLPVAQHWTLVDHDPELLALASVPAGVPPTTLRSVCADLGEWALAAAAPELVTASALLDLVSGQWLDRLVRECVHHRAAALLVLSYDGNVTWTTPDPDDAFVHAAVNDHQARDKGLGAALGPLASAVAAERFRAAGYRVWAEPSPWQMDAGALALAEQLIAGWVEAAAEQLPEAAVRIRNWGTRRLHDLRTGRTNLRVGHRDLLALPGLDR